MRYKLLVKITFQELGLNSRKKIWSIYGDIIV